ncbi:hypothetical protein LG3211_1718 [Lysobacter gummosus]|nr:hypothetical protein LG3211_1718 [Lysobacter gummosus]
MPCPHPRAGTLAAGLGVDAIAGPTFARFRPDRASATLAHPRRHEAACSRSRRRLESTALHGPRTRSGQIRRGVRVVEGARLESV